MRSASRDVYPGRGYVEVEWDDPRGNGDVIRYYDVYVNDAYSGRTSSRSYTVPNLRGGQQISVRVASCNLRGCGAPGNALVTDAARTKPDVPTGLTIAPGKPD